MPIAGFSTYQSGVVQQRIFADSIQNPWRQEGLMQRQWQIWDRWYDLLCPVQQRWSKSHNVDFVGCVGCLDNGDRPHHFPCVIDTFQILNTHTLLVLSGRSCYLTISIVIFLSCRVCLKMGVTWSTKDPCSHGGVQQVEAWQGVTLGTPLFFHFGGYEYFLCPCYHVPFFRVDVFPFLFLV